MSNSTSSTNMTVAQNLAVGGNTTLSNPLTSSSSGTFGGGLISTTLNTTGNINQTGGSITSGSGGINCNGNLAVLGNCALYSDFTTNGTLNINGNIVTNTAIISTTELSYLDGATSNLQSQLNLLQNKTADLTHSDVNNTFNNNLIVSGNITAQDLILNRNIITNGITLSVAELSYLDGVTSSVQTQLSTLQSKTTDITRSGTTNYIANDLTVSGVTSATAFNCNGNLQINKSSMNVDPYIDLSIANSDYDVRFTGSGGSASSKGTGSLAISASGGVSMTGLLGANAGIDLPPGQNINLRGGITAYATTISPIEVSYLTGLTQNLNTSITTLQNKCTDLTHSGNTNTINNNLVVNGSSTLSDLTISGSGVFPTTNTSSTQGLSTYYNYEGNNEVDLLSRASSSTNGGFSFYTSNSTTAPKQLMSISKLGNLKTSSAQLSNSGGIALDVTSGDTRVAGNIKMLAPNSSAFPTLSMIDYTGTTTLASLYPSVNSVNLDLSNSLSGGLIVSSAGSNLLKVDNYGHGTFNAGITSKTIKTYENQLISASQTKNNVGLVGTWNISQHFTKTINVICPISIRLVTNNSSGNNSMFYSVMSGCSYVISKNGIPFTTGTPTSSTTLPKGVYFVSSVNGTNSHTYLSTLTFSFACSDDDIASVYTAVLNVTKTAFTVSVSDIYVNTDVTNVQLGTNVSVTNGTTAGDYYQSPSYSISLNSVATVIGSTEVNDFFTKGEAHTIGSLTTHGTLQVNGDNTFLGNGTLPTTATGGTQGLSVYWNKSSGIGEVDFLARGQGGVGGYQFYASSGNTAPYLLTSISNTGLLTTNSISTNNLYYKGQMGASMLNSAGATGSFPIFYSIADYTNFYPNRPSGMISVGNYASYNNNDRDDGYIIYPGFKLTVWATNNYTGNIVLDVMNTSAYPIVVNPTSNDIGSSCKLFTDNGNTELNY